MAFSMAYRAWHGIWCGLACLSVYMVWPCGHGMTYAIAWLVWHGTWYCLAGLAWYMVYPTLWHGIWYCLARFRMVYGVAWQDDMYILRLGGHGIWCGLAGMTC